MRSIVFGPQVLVSSAFTHSFPGMGSRERTDEVHSAQHLTWQWPLDEQFVVTDQAKHPICYVQLCVIEPAKDPATPAHTEPFHLP